MQSAGESILGLRAEHTSGHIYRACMEGVAYTLRRLLELLQQNGMTIPPLTATDGAAQSRNWMQILCDVIQLPIEIPTTQTGSEIGAAYFGAIATGLLDPLRIPKPRCTTLYPSTNNKEVYDSYYASYQQIYARNADMLHVLCAN